jgi:hypothetical protein
MNAARFRDEYDDEPDGAFFAIADEQGLTEELIEMAEWKAANTNIGEEKSEQ